MTRLTLAAATLVFAGSLALSAAPQAPARPVQKLPAPAGALPPLPVVPFEPVVPRAVAQQVYEFAARHPEVLEYIPCYCGCERMGHKGNDDCFVKSRTANGRVTEWEAHGLGCEVCMNVARRSMAMFNQGMSVPEIRAAIEREYARYPSHTPTPYPPKAKAKTAKKG